MGRQSFLVAACSYVIAISFALLFAGGSEAASTSEASAALTGISYAEGVQFVSESDYHTVSAKDVTFAVPDSEGSSLLWNIPVPNESRVPGTSTSPIVARPTLNPKLVERESPIPAQRARNSAFGLDAGVERLTYRTPSLPPLAFVRFCLRYPEDCKITGIAFRPKPIELTPARRAELTQVNRDVNRAIAPQANNKGVAAEEWIISPREGDCNDYAVTKRHELLKRGWPSRALFLAEVVVPSGEHHLILVVRTREDDFVLDNLNWNVRPIAQIRYEWVRAQQANNPKFWSSANVTRPARVAMNSH